MLSIPSTADELSGATNIDDLECLWILKSVILVFFSRF